MKQTSARMNENRSGWARYKRAYGYGYLLFTAFTKKLIMKQVTAPKNEKVTSNQ